MKICVPMIKVKNSKIVHYLADKSLQANKTRNIIAIIAIALTALLFTTLFTMGLGTVESLQQATMRQAGSDGHAVLKYLTDDEFNKVKSHPLIKEIAYERLLSSKITNRELLKRHAEFWYYDEVGLKLGFIELEEGRQPVAENEVIADSETLKLLDVPLKVGTPLTLNLLIHDKEVQRDFILSGWWKSDPVFNVGQIFASKAYVDAHAEELHSTYKQDCDTTGVISAYLMFDNSLDLQGKLNQVINESGFSLDKNASNYIEGNVNWSYLSTNFSFDGGTIVALSAGLLLIMLTGYLIIYNIFQISVMRDIRFYGLLKTIGTSSRQIRRIIRRQALFLSAIGVPIGLLGGYFVGKSFVPLLMSNSSFVSGEVKVSPSPWIFIGSALFAVMTVMISTFKPGRMAAAVSPVEAARYVDRGTTRRIGKPKKSANGAKMPLMAYANLGRHKKRTVLVVISLALSLVLLNTTFTLSQSMDMDKYLASYIDSDFLIAHADYFKENFTGLDNETSESFVQAVQQQPGFEEGGRIYSGTNIFSVDYIKNEEGYEPDARGHLPVTAYGLEKLPLHRLQWIDGKSDFNKLASGNYILEGVPLDDNNNPEMQYARYQIGQKVTLHSDQMNTSREFTVLGHVGLTSTNSGTDAAGYASFYLPAEIFKSLVKQPAVMSYAFNISTDQETAMEAFLKNYTETTEPMMHYRSKFIVMNEFKGLQDTVNMIGGTLSLIIGLIGMLNFANAILTGILTRRQEFAILQSIGMTMKQLRTMLVYEGLYYVAGTSLCSVLLGSLFSVLVAKPLSNLMWFMNYHFILWPQIAMLPILLVMGGCLPIAIYAWSGKQSIVERLRSIE
ncbi:peptide ABC transporter permease [Paenibacillus macerans]|nr:ABC transporter permease [Paenibacillus macerans]GBK69046.1 ABC transporter permease [Paenibacillus macerans]GIP13415.1 efflux ABC transporter permease [Paenibacillus macerans]SUD26992.1 peptide ABC transporter permease [Paenibacillus macerans]